MSLFEYVSIPVSLILTFGIARLLSGFPYLLSGRGTYWVHTLWCVQALLNYLLFWWLHWNLSSYETWTLGSYLLILLYPALCYLGATIFMPAEASHETDWHAYFFRARRMIFGVSTLATTTLILTGIALGGLSWSNPGTFVGGLAISIYVVGFMTAHETAHKVIVLANAAFVAGAYVPLIYRPIG